MVFFQQPEPGSRRNIAVGGGRIGPLPSIPRPNTALGTRGELYKGNPPLIETSESEDTENNSKGLQRPRSSSSMLVSYNAQWNSPKLIQIL